MVNKKNKTSLKDQKTKLKELARIKKERESLKSMMDSDIASVLDSPGGRRVLWRILSYCGLYEYLGGDIKPAEQQQGLGRRGVGLWIISLLNEVDSNAYANLQLEASGGKLNYE